MFTLPDFEKYVKIYICVEEIVYIYLYIGGEVTTRYV